MPKPEYTPQQLAIFFHGMQHARDLAQQAERRNIAARAIQKDIRTLSLYAEQKKAI